MDPHRKLFNEKQQLLLHTLEDVSQHRLAIDLFLGLQGMVHSSQMTGAATIWSFEDEVLQGLDETTLRSIPAGDEHSIAWILWHIARCEDVTMNILIANGEQVLLKNGWLTQMGIDSRETGNALDPAEIVVFSQSVNLDALKAYRIAVGHRTREIVRNLEAAELQQVVDPDRLARVRVEGAVVESTRWLADYWSKKTLGGLLLMPPTRHNFLHLNEAARIKKKLGRRVTQ